MQLLKPLPCFVSSGTTVQLGQEYTYTVAATDNDIGDQVTFSAVQILLG